ncbi:MAG: hypothetical protein JNJ94_12495 [Chlorobi bacterium]|nr:hypothetical protein [Chlorobiota bacterium]
MVYLPVFGGYFLGAQKYASAFRDVKAFFYWYDFFLCCEFCVIFYHGNRLIFFTPPQQLLLPLAYGQQTQLRKKGFHHPNIFFFSLLFSGMLGCA